MDNYYVTGTANYVFGVDGVKADGKCKKGTFTKVVLANSRKDAVEKARIFCEQKYTKHDKGVWKRFESLIVNHVYKEVLDGA